MAPQYVFCGLSKRAEIFLVLSVLTSTDKTVNISFPFGNGTSNFEKVWFLRITDF